MLYAGNCAGCHTPIDRNDLSTPLKVKQVRLKAHDGEGADRHRSLDGLQCLYLHFTERELLRFSDSWNRNSDKVRNRGDRGQDRGYAGGRRLSCHFRKEAGDGRRHSGDRCRNPARKRSVANVGFHHVAGIDGRKNCRIRKHCDFVPCSPVARFSYSYGQGATQGVLPEHRPRLHLGYIARPLNGIWATAPYLHNGSVPTLYDLLLPAEQRPRTFYTGSNEFDPVKVGYVRPPAAITASSSTPRWKVTPMPVTSSGSRLLHRNG